MSEFGMVFMTASSRQEAETIGRSLVEKRLAACFQVLSECRSLYWWEGALCTENEIMCIAKTRASLFEALAAEIRRLHSYSVPEIVYVPIQTATGDYLDWIAAETRLPPDTPTCG
jgi:periplasmic divalent cation tolerance protein